MSQPTVPERHRSCLDQIFREARTRNGWAPDPIPEADLRAIYDLAKMGPTSANMSPARFVWVVASPGEAKQTLAGLAMPSNGAKIMAAPVTVIIGYDLDFPVHMPRLFPHNPDAANWFNDPVARESAAFRNGSLQGAYLMVAARAMGYDCGPMSGFNNAGVGRGGFPERHAGQVQLHLLHRQGHRREPVRPLAAPWTFEEAGRIV